MGADTSATPSRSLLVRGRHANPPLPRPSGEFVLSPFIFAKISSIWKWTGSGYRDDQAGNPEEAVYNKTESLSNPTKVPKVRPLGTCKSGEKCLESQLPGLTINGRSDGNVVFPTEVAKVTLKFFGYANKDQMPIRKVKVNWGDGAIVDLNGYFRNERGVANGKCIKEALKPNKTCHLDGGNVDGNNQPLYDFDVDKRCATDSDCNYLDSCYPENTASNFGQIANKTCDNNYFKFDHVYQCVEDGEGWRPVCPEIQTQALYGGCCVFSPAVQLKDNWGWCNGSCPDAAGFPAGGPGCYEKDWGNPANWSKECSNINDPVVTPWTKFDNGIGKIIVAPN